jgi:hypothetical protein
MILGRKEPEAAILNIFVFESSGHGLHCAVPGVIQTEHHKGAIFQCAPELFFDLAIISHVASPLLSNRNGHGAADVPISANLWPA